MTEVSLSRLKMALDSLRRGYTDSPSELERDGLIQRFEYSLELCWKTSKKVLFFNGIESDSPKNVIREMAQLGWISNPEVWIDYIDKRNQTSHIYNEQVALEIFSVIKAFIEDSENLFQTLDQKRK